MLVLSRKTGENLVIGQNVVVTVLQVRGNRVRMGIDAGNGTSVMRHEVYMTRLEGERPVYPPAAATTA